MKKYLILLFFIAELLFYSTAFSQDEARLLTDTLTDMQTGSKFFRDKPKNQLIGVNGQGTILWKTDPRFDDTDSLLLGGKPELLSIIHFNFISENKKIIMVTYSNRSFVTLDPETGRLITKWKN